MDPHEQERSVIQLEKKIDRLRALYDQYFLGIEKLEPQIPRKEVDRLMVALRRERIRNTAVRFRFLQQVQRYNTMATYWNRVARQIEEGTYQRRLMRNRPAPEERSEVARDNLPSHEIDLTEFDDAGDPMAAALYDNEPTSHGMELPENEPTNPAVSVAPRAPAGMVGDSTAPDLVLPEHMSRPSAPTPAASAATSSSRGYVPSGPRGSSQPPRRPAPQSPSPGGRPAGGGAPPAGDAMRSVYERYIAARKQCNEPVKGLTYDKVKAQLKTREEALKKKHGKDVDFEVKIKNGRAVLRAKPRKP